MLVAFFTVPGLVSIVFLSCMSKGGLVSLCEGEWGDVCTLSFLGW